MLEKKYVKHAFLFFFFVQFRIIQFRFNQSSSLDFVLEKNKHSLESLKAAK